MPRKYRAAIFMAILAVASLVIHLYTGWQAAMDEAPAHGPHNVPAPVKGGLDMYIGGGLITVLLIILILVLIF